MCVLDMWYMFCIYRTQKFFLFVFFWEVLSRARDEGDTCEVKLGSTLWDQEKKVPTKGYGGSMWGREPGTFTWLQRLDEGM